jgi:hypothetical protein
MAAPWQKSFHFNSGSVPACCAALYLALRSFMISACSCRTPPRAVAPTKVVMQIEGQCIDMKDLSSSCPSPRNPIPNPSCSRLLAGPRGQPFGRFKNHSRDDSDGKDQASVRVNMRPEHALIEAFCGSYMKFLRRMGRASDDGFNQHLLISLTFGLGCKTCRLATLSETDTLPAGNVATGSSNCSSARSVGSGNAAWLASMVICPPTSG